MLLETVHSATRAAAWSYGVLVNTYVFHCGDWGSYPGCAVKFHIANLYIKMQ